MTTSELTTPYADPPAAGPDATLDTAYLQRLLEVDGGRVRCPRLLTWPEAVWRQEDTGDGLTTLVLRADGLLDDIRRALYRFRLVEFLRAGLMSAETARRGRLDREPADATTVHAVTVDGSGRIVGYLGLVGSPDHPARVLDDPHRWRFPVEEAHGVDVLAPFAGEPLTTAHAYELKRFVRSAGLEPGRARDAVSWHLISALGHAALELGTVRLLVGDSREDGALRHFRLVGFAPVVWQHTSPSLPRTSLMWPSYITAVTARPFAGIMPDGLAAVLEVIDSALTTDTTPGWQRRTIARLGGRRAAP